MTALTLVPLIEQLVELGLTVAPEIISAAQTELSLFATSTAPTAEQQAAIDAAYAQASSGLQAAQPASA
jgi:hypothetical protein